MSKSESNRFSEEDLLKKGFVRDGAGCFVPVPKNASGANDRHATEINNRLAFNKQSDVTGRETSKSKTPMLERAFNQVDPNAQVNYVKHPNGVREIVYSESKKPFNPKENLFAKGRLKRGVMNKTESAYFQYLNALKFSGEIAWFCFEGFKMKLADNTTLTPDFAILYPNGRFVFHDVKGAKILIQDDAKAKMKVAAEIFPFEFFIVLPKKQKDGGGWIVEQINPDKNK